MTAYAKLDVALPEGREDVATIVMPAGVYYLGDPCYSVQNDQWHDWLEAAEYRSVNTYALAATIDGRPVLGFGTAFGDGVYADQHGNTYPVDAGLIGLVPVDIAKDAGDLVQRVEFDRPFTCTMDAGVLTFGTYVIDTAGEEDDDEY